MAARATTPTCSLTLPLVVEKWQADRLDKRFETARKLYNQFVGFELKKLNRLKHTPEYRENQKQLAASVSTEKSDEAKRKELYAVRNTLLKEAGFTEFSFTNDMTKVRRYYNNVIGSIVAQSVSNNAWKAFHTLLFKKGDRVHFKKVGQLNSLSGKSVDKEIHIDVGAKLVTWLGLQVPFRVEWNNAYEAAMLKKPIKYSRILRKWVKSGYKYYVQIVLAGIPEQKTDHEGNLRHPLGHGRVGIDIGTQTIAYVSDTRVGLEELADRVTNMEQEKRRLQRKLDRSRRATNPNNYCSDGTIRRGIKLTHNRSNRYKNTLAQLKEAQRKQAALRALQHHVLVNRLIPLGDTFYVETMNISGLAKRAKNTEKSERTGRFKRKRRFGKSIANKAPASLLVMLNSKLKAMGNAGLIQIDTIAAKASQFDHTSGEYRKKGLSERWENLSNGDRIQRDIYSAFLIQNTDASLCAFDQALLDEKYERFKSMHDECIEILRNDLTHPLSSMGLSCEP